MQQQEILPCCLTIAGSDSGGNAGVQADLRAFHAYGVHGCTVFSALTAQNPFGVSAIHAVPAEFVAAQLDAVLGVYNIRGIKVGMLSNVEAIRVIAERLKRYDGVAKVIDPVMIATSGAKLIDDEAMAESVSTLLPMATLITPNLPEAQVLAGKMVGGREAGVEQARELARILFDRLGCAVLVKGGHGSGAKAVDVLFDGKDIHEFGDSWITAPISTHGTGCSLSSALAAELALGHSLVDAVAGAKRYVHQAIATSYWVGENCGVLGFVDFATFVP